MTDHQEEYPSQTAPVKVPKKVKAKGKTLLLKKPWSPTPGSGRGQSRPETSADQVDCLDSG
ncbi:MAG: hypothetical protein R2720_00095 [Candidatus Nanopelagicales bacterium]